MSKISRITITLGAVSLFSSLSFADNLPSVTKAVWLDRFKAMAPAAMCQQMLRSDATKKVLDTSKIDYNKCVPMITKSMNNCLVKFNNSLPANFDMESGRKWGEQIGRCSGADFYLNNIATKTS